MEENVDGRLAVNRDWCAYRPYQVLITWNIFNTVSFLTICLMIVDQTFPARYVDGRLAVNKFRFVCLCRPYFKC